MVDDIVTNGLNMFYSYISDSIPDNYKPYFILAFFTILVVAYCIFVWKLYQFLGKKDILDLNLSQYNTFEHPTTKKLTAIVLFLLEYVIIIPVLISVWFSFLAIFFIVMSENENVAQIMLFCAVIIAATRILAYYSKDLSKELGLLFPFTLLIVLLLEPGSFSIPQLISKFSQIPSLFYNIFSYFIFIVGLEVVMRIISIIFPYEPE